jgi:SNF2 family DNA or RNA helicase
MRLHQITCGHFTADDGSVKEIKNERLDALIDILREVENKAVIWAHYRYDIEAIIKAVEKEFGKDSYVTYYGDTPQSDRQNNIKLLQDPNSSVKFLIGTPQTGGYGITLTEANTMIYYSNGYDLEKSHSIPSAHLLFLRNTYICPIDYIFSDCHGIGTPFW